MYFDDSQLQNLIYHPYRNDNCTYFFEHSVMKDLINGQKHIGSDYFGVVSHSLVDKIGDFKRFSKGIKIANTSTTEFTPSKFEQELKNYRPDVLSYQRHMPHDPISLADRYHPNFSHYFKNILLEAGYDWTPTVFQDVFYCNYFVCKSEIYERFVKEMLSPCMEVMDAMPELKSNSNYPKTLPDHLRKSWGLNHYPYHAFLCERMFSYFAHLNKLECIHY